ncbi:MAG: signal peptidase I [Desulfobacteraceae bacterium]
MTICAALLLAGSIRSAIADWNLVPTGSMNPTIVEGDRILVNKLAYDLKLPFTNRHLYTWQNPQRGDIVVFIAPETEIPMVKRVVGVPGDSIFMQDNHLYINGKPVLYENLSEKQKDLLAPECDYFQRVLIENLNGYKHSVILTPYRPSKNSFDPIPIPRDHYLVLGDNRDNSADSRYFGLVKRWRIMGQATTVMISLDLTDDNRPRWKRFFKPLL